MKKIIAAMIMTLLAGTAQAETIKVTVNGLVCSFCATGIEKTFNKQPAVNNVKVDLDARLVTIDTKSTETLSNENITKLLTDAGYTVTGITRQK